MKHKKSVWCIFTMGLLWQASSLCFADSYPDHPLKLIVPGAAGSVLDINARKIGDKLSRSLAQPVIVDNRPGAAGNLGADVAAKSKADGYTVFIGGSSTISINPLLYSNLPFNWYSPRSWRVDKTVFDFKRSSPVLFFCAVIPRGLATGIGTGRAEQIYSHS